MGKKRCGLGIVLGLMIFALGSAASGAPFMALDLGNHWATEYLVEAVQRGWIVGYGDGTVRPDSMITRAEFAAVLCRIIDKEADSKAAARLVPVFRDLDGSHWAVGYLRICKELGILLGDPNGRVRADCRINRAEMVATLSRLADRLGWSGSGEGGVRFVDRAEIPEWALGPVGSMSTMGVVLGDDKGRFNPHADCTRAEATAVLARLCDVCGMRWDLFGTITDVDLTTGTLKVAVGGDLVVLTLDKDTCVFKNALVAPDHLAVNDSCKVLVSRTSGATVLFVLVEL